MASQPGGAQFSVRGDPKRYVTQAAPMAQAERLLFMTHRRAAHALRLSHWDEVEGGPITPGA